MVAAIGLIAAIACLEVQADPHGPVHAQYPGSMGPGRMSPGHMSPGLMSPPAGHRPPMSQNYPDDFESGHMPYDPVHNRPLGGMVHTESVPAPSASKASRPKFHSIEGLKKDLDQISARMQSSQTAQHLITKARPALERLQNSAAKWPQRLGRSQRAGSPVHSGSSAHSAGPVPVGPPRPMAPPSVREHHQAYAGSPSQPSASFDSHNYKY
jgi:hypothetical protein